MTVRRLFQLLVGGLLAIAAASAVLVWKAAEGQRQLVEGQRARFLGYVLADQLRQSSDELTRFARSYAVTGDPKYERFYREVLAIRNGHAPLPQRYERVYWDFASAPGYPLPPRGRPVAMRERMRRAGFTQAELDLSQRALDESDALVQIEETAIHAVQGLFRDQDGGLTRRGEPNKALAARLLHDGAYHQEKARIMQPIDALLKSIDERTVAELESFRRQNAVRLTSLKGLLGLFLVASLAAYPLLRSRVLSPVSALQKQTRRVAYDLKGLAEVAARIAQGDLDSSFATSAPRLQSTRQDEIGDLSRLHDSMQAELVNAAAAVAHMTAELRAKNEALSSQMAVVDQAKRVAEAADRSKSEFLANMSHEVRTPLNAILGMAHLALQSALTPDQQQHLARIRTAAEELRAVVDDVLDFSEIEAGRLELEPVEFSLDDLLAGVSTAVTPMAEQKGLKLTLRSAAGTARRLRGDPRRLHQILVNLASNAIKFTRVGEVALTVQQEPQGAERSVTRFVVSDTGVGIPAERIPELFRPFSQGDSSTTREHGGTGLGLFLCRSLAELMGGEVVVDSQVGRGSTFSLLVPLEVARESPRQGLVAADGSLAPQAQAQRAARLRGMRVLVTDDNEINRQVLQGLLGKAGCEVTLAATGEEAIALVAHGELDAVLMDVQMPGMDGHEATRRIRALASAPAELPIIAVTAHARPEDAELARAAGMSDHVTKPVDPVRLVSVLSHWAKARPMPSPQPQSTTTVGAASLPPATSCLPEALPGIDLRDGLQRIGGNASAYRQVLTGFHARFAASAREIMALLEQGELAEARLRAHTLRGVAGNVGAAALAGDAAVVEEAIRSGATLELPARVRALEASLNQVMSGLAALAEPNKPERLTDSEARLRIRQLPTEVVEALREAARRASLKAIEDAIARASARDPGLAGTLEDLAERFDYPAIERLLP